MLISLTSLAMTSKFQKNICFKTRAVGLINIKTKECKSGRHLWKWSITSGDYHFLRIGSATADSWVLPNLEKLIILPEQDQCGLSEAVLNSSKVTRPIHLVPKWRPINYSFVSMLISPLLVNMYKKQKNFEVKLRRRGLINVQTK